MDFFNGLTTLQLARGLLGCVLVREAPEGRMAGVIRETEAYTETDEACHAFSGRKTARNQTMYMRAGHIYVYFTYGMYHCLNVVSEREGKGCAVLLRAVEPTEGIDLMRKNRRSGAGLADGPGKLCQAFGIDRYHDGMDITDGESPIYLVCRRGRPSVVRRMPRVGISRGTDKLWRFVAG